MKKKIANFELSEQQLQKEMKRVERGHRRRSVVISTIVVLLAIVTMAAVAAVLWFPVFRITGNPTLEPLEPGQVVLAYRTEQLQKDDVAAFYQENKLRIQRVAASAGDVIDLDDDGTIMVNGETIEGLNSKNLVLNGSAVTYPYQVPEGYCFVMDDHGTIHDTSALEAEFISTEQIAGKILFLLWPINRLEYLG